jgi:DNA-binding response OmpR family regulator
MKILIVEDDPKIIALLQDAFIEKGYSVDAMIDSKDGEYLAQINQYDVIILDWMMPYRSGLDILNTIRQGGNTTPVILLTAKDAISNKVEGLNSGADDYLTKPFSIEELFARVDALYRRSAFRGSNKISFEDIEIDLESKVVSKAQKIIPLSAKEYELLLFLVKHKNSYVSKYMLEEQLWRDKEFLSSNVIEVTIFNLRRKLSKDLIQNFKGLGYKIEIV